MYLNFSLCESFSLIFCVSLQLFYLEFKHLNLQASQHQASRMWTTLVLFLDEMASQFIIEVCKTVPFSGPEKMLSASLDL